MKKAPNATDVHIGSRVRMRRMMLGMSQEKLGDALGLTFQQVQKYEKGANRIGGSRMVQIATVLGVAPAYFYEGAPGAPGTVADEGADLVQMLLATSDGIALARAMARIQRSDHRRAVVNVAEALAVDTPKERAKAA